MPSFSTQQIADHINGRLEGPPDQPITGIEILNRALGDQLSFIRDTRYIGTWERSKAGVVLVKHEMVLPENHGRAVIFVPNPDLAIIEILKMFAPPKPMPQTGIHPMAVVDPLAEIGQNVAIGPFCVIGALAKVGDGCVLHGTVHLADHVELGPGCELFAGVVIREYCKLASHVTIHANTVIGADGFGYELSEDKESLVKIPHIGHVEIGHHVEIGANSCIDRGKFSATYIGDGTKIDNLCQIAHNCKIGRLCAIAGQTGIAGSTTIGDGVLIGGKVAIRDNVTIGDGVKLAGSSVVGCNIPAGEMWGGYPARDAASAIREVTAIRKLPEIVKAYRAEQQAERRKKKLAEAALQEKEQTKSAKLMASKETQQT